MALIAQDGSGHTVTHMIALQYRPSRRARTWRTAYRMHEAGRANMEKDAPALSRQDGWYDWRIVREAV